MSERFPTPYEVDYSQRDPADGVDEMFYHRWSPRAFKQVELPDAVLATIFDAPRWSPSSRNEQPWVFITASAEDKDAFATFVGLLIDDNQVWAKNASLLGFIVARRHFTHNGKPNASAQFDCGAAWMAMTLQARKFGLYTHGMGGIHRQDVYEKLNIPEADYEVICGFALGCVDVPGQLPDDIKSVELPSQRKPLNEIWLRNKMA